MFFYYDYYYYYVTTVLVAALALFSTCMMIHRCDIVIFTVRSIAQPFFEYGC